MKTLLVLEDSEERIAGLKAVLPELDGDWEVHVWRDAPTMLAECERFFPNAGLISLDHDLQPLPGCTGDPGTGVDVANFLAGYLPVCPVIVHSSNTDRSWSMLNELRHAGWTVDRVGPIGDDWIHALWLPKAREMIAWQKHENRPPLNGSHPDCLHRALVSLRGLAVGDAVGEMLAARHSNAGRIVEDGLPAGPWFHTDDTEMAISIVEILRLYGRIQPDALARRFAWRFQHDPDRGYGSATRSQLHEVDRGGDWRKIAVAAFSGNGSMGNGAAMRVAPVGAYFADNLARAIDEAATSARVTHTHAEGVAGAIAVAVAASMAWRLRNRGHDRQPTELIEAVLEHTPDGTVRRGLAKALQISATFPLDAVVRLLGNGSRVTAPDTVPFAVWCAAHHLADFRTAIVQAISAGGDCDTNAAIVGGIVALSVGDAGIPTDWKESHEEFPTGLQ